MTKRQRINPHDRGTAEHVLGHPVPGAAKLIEGPKNV